MGSTLKFDIGHQWPTPHAQSTLKSWARLNKLIKAGSIDLDGESLDLASVVAIARFDIKALYIVSIC
jgi:phenylalanine ammonia-lyase